MDIKKKIGTMFFLIAMMITIVPYKVSAKSVCALKTGDDSSPVTWILLATAALVLLVLLFLVGRIKKK